MPVKNVKRKTNDGFEGVITGLNDKEKEIIANSVASDRCLQNKNGNYTSTDGERITNSITFSDEELTKIRNGEIDIISGEYIYDSNGNSESYNAIRESLMEYEGQRYAFYRGSLVNDFTTTTIEVREFQLIVNPDGSSLIQIWKRQQIKTPTLPVGHMLKTYTLKSVNGEITWVDEQVYSINHEISLSMIPTIVNGIYLDLYLADDKTALNQFIENGKGIVKANLETPIGTINVNLFPIANNVYAGSYPLFTDLTDYGGSVFNILNVWLEGSNPDPKLDFSITPLIPVMPMPPSDSATKTYTLKVSNGKITWVEG